MAGVALGAVVTQGRFPSAPARAGRDYEPPRHLVILTAIALGAVTLAAWAWLLAAQPDIP